MLIKLVVFVYLYIYLFINMSMINCQMAVRILLKICRYDIQISESNLAMSVQTPLFKCSD